MDNNMLIIHPDDTITRAQYDGLKSLQKGVGGYIELFSEETLKINGSDINVIMYCDEEFLLKNDGNSCRINALATKLSEVTVYGDVVLIGVDGEDEKPFEEKLCKELENYLDKYKEDNSKTLKNLHNRYDGIIRLTPKGIRVIPENPKTEKKER